MPGRSILDSNGFLLDSRRDGFFQFSLCFLSFLQKYKGGFDKCLRFMLIFLEYPLGSEGVCRPFLQGEAMQSADRRFMQAVENDNAKVVQALIQEGANIYAENDDGLTALMLAALNNTDPEVLQILLEEGAELSEEHRYGFTALDLAVLNPNPGVAGLLKLAARNDPEMASALKVRPSSEEMKALLVSLNICRK